MLVAVGVLGLEWWEGEGECVAKGKKYSPTVSEGVEAVGGGAGGRQVGVVCAFERLTCW